MPPLEYVRVRDISTGHHYSVLVQEAEYNAHAYDVLKDEPATNANGDPLPGHIPVAQAGPTGEPPRTGTGSGVKAWADYATSLGIDVPEDATRDQVVELVDAHPKENS